MLREKRGEASYLEQSTINYQLARMLNDMGYYLVCLGHPEEAIRKVVYDNPLSFFRQCARWQEWEFEPQRHRDTEKRKSVKTAG